MSGKNNTSTTEEVSSITISEPNKDIETVSIELKETDKMIPEKKNISVLLKIFNDLFETQEKIDSLKVKVNIEEKDLAFIKKILQEAPELFNDIDNGIESILKDKVIDSKDIPQIIKLVKDAYKNIISSNKNIKKITLEDSLIFIKNILFILMEYDYIKVSNKDELNIMIDLCIDLLQTNLDLKKSLLSNICACLSLFSKFSK
jgi:hypothetical protein